MKFCPNCGKSINFEGSKFCYHCGFQLPFEVSSNENKINNFKINEKIKIYNDDAKIENGVLKSYTGDEEDIVLPDDVKVIGSYGFSNTYKYAKTITLNDGVTEIKEKAFYSIPTVTKIFIPKTVTKIDERAFFVGFDNPTNQFIGCVSLTEIVVDEKNPKYKSINGDLYTKDGTTLLKYAPGKTNKEFVLPKGVEKISFVAGLVNCNHLSKIVLPSTFGNNGEFILKLPDQEKPIEIEIDKNNPNYKMIDGHVYSKDGKTFSLYNIGKKGKTFIVPDSVKRIDDCAFSYSSLKTIVIPEGVTEIGEYAFSDCYDLTSITLPNTIKSMGISAFANCENLKSITLPSNLKMIENGTFDACGIQNITIPTGIQEIDDFAFINCDIQNVIIPSTVKKLGEGAFDQCHNLENITLSNGLEIISNEAFSYCSKLKAITIPSSVKQIGEDVFIGCDNLKTIIISSGKKYNNLPKNIKIIEC